MVRNASWLLLGCLAFAAVGCGGGGDAPQAANNNNAAPAPAPAGPPPGMAAPGGAAPPGMGGPGMGGPGMGAPGMGAPGMAAPGAPGAAAPAAAQASTGTPKDPLVYLPGNVTFAVGGLPSAVVKSTNKVAASFLAQFSPLTTALAKVGLPPQNFESFWAAGTADLGEQALCVITAADINQEALKQALGADKIPKDSRVWPLPGELAATHAIAVADSRTVIIGRRTTVEASLRKSPALIIKQGLGTINQVDADFWMAGDAPAAETYFASGLPLLGSYHKPFKDLKAFAVGMILEGKTLTPVNPSGGMGGAPGMMGGPGMGGGPGMAPGMGGAPAGYPGGPGGYPGGPGGYPGGPGAPGSTAPPVGTDPVGVMVMAGFVFESEAAATTIKVPFDAYLTAGAKKTGPKMGRYVPDLLGTASSTNQYGAGPGANPGAAMAAMQRNSGKPMGSVPPGYPNSPGTPGGPGDTASSVPVVLEEPPAGSAAPADQRLQPVTPPPPQIVSNTPPAADGSAPGGTPMPGGPPMPGGVSGPGAYSNPNPMPAGSEYGRGPANYGRGGPGMMPGMPGMPGMNGQGGTGFDGFAGRWVQQQGAIVQIAYRFDALDENVAFGSHLLRALGISPLGDALTPGPLVALHKAAEQWRGAGAGSAFKSAPGFGPHGASWMINLLPYMGHEALYKRFDFNKPLSDAKNAKLTHSIIPEFLNPADPRQQWAGAPYSGMGLTHYVGMSGVEEDHGAAAATLPRNDPKAGIFGYDGVATPDMITDGQSQTIMMLGSGDLASPWAAGGGATIRGARPKSFSPHSGFGSAGGPKPGAYVLFADGSVRFVAADVDQQVFRAMSTTHGKETVDLQGLQSSGSLAGK